METFGLVRQARKQPLVLILLMGGLVSAIICFELQHALGQGAALSDPRYLVSRRALEMGEAVSFLDFGQVSARDQKSPPPAGALTDQDWDRLKGATLSRGIREGEYLSSVSVRFPVRGGLRSSTIPAGLLAFAIAPSNTLGVRPGDRLDILLNPESAHEAPAILIEDTLVLGIEAVTEEQGKNAVIIAVSQDEIELLEKAQQKGKLKIALRNPHDRPGRQRRINARKLWHTAKQPPRVQIWSEEP